MRDSRRACQRVAVAVGVTVVGVVAVVFAVAGVVALAAVVTAVVAVVCVETGALGTTVALVALGTVATGGTGFACVADTDAGLLRWFAIAFSHIRRRTHSRLYRSRSSSANFWHWLRTASGAPLNSACSSEYVFLGDTTVVAGVVTGVVVPVAGAGAVGCVDSLSAVATRGFSSYMRQKNWNADRGCTGCTGGVGDGVYTLLGVADSAGVDRGVARGFFATCASSTSTFGFGPGFLPRFFFSSTGTEATAVDPTALPPLALALVPFAAASSAGGAPALGLRNLSATNVSGSVVTLALPGGCQRSGSPDGSA